MEQELVIYNTRTRRKEKFEPLTPGRVGMYVCGPTVYGDPHLGHARSAITFDVLFRYLRHTGYEVRYVRNITDVGHLEHDSDEGEDKIAKKARLEQTEPMEVAQHYANRYHEAMRALNVEDPSIEPSASGHIIEQERLVDEILSNRFAYVSNGSVYFDIEAYNKAHRYGVLSGRSLDDVISGSRELTGTDEKRNKADFALWKRAQPSHIMRWPSKWGDGFPGWHTECVAMGRKYLGARFDIHGGGMDLVFPHHECEIAQAVAAQGSEMVRYWMHNNMVTVEGQKMGKSLGNFITLEEFFTGRHPKLAAAYPPMTIRFFILQAHYRSTVDFSNEALRSSGKGLERLLAGYRQLERLVPAEDGSVTESYADGLTARCYEAMNDDLNTPVVAGLLFDACRTINQAAARAASITPGAAVKLQKLFDVFAFGVLGLRKEAAAGAVREEAYAGAVDMLLEMRRKAKDAKDWATSDRIRDGLARLGFEVKDTRDGAVWRLDK